MNENNGLVFAYILDGKFGGTAVDWKGIKNLYILLTTSPIFLNKYIDY